KYLAGLAPVSGICGPETREGAAQAPSRSSGPSDDSVGLGPAALGCGDGHGVGRGEHVERPTQTREAPILIGHTLAFGWLVGEVGPDNEPVLSVRDVERRVDPQEVRVDPTRVGQGVVGVAVEV